MGFQLFTLVAKCFIAAWWIHYHLILTITHLFIAKPRCISIDPLFLSRIILQLILINLICHQIIHLLVFIYYFDISELSFLICDVNIAVGRWEHSDSNFALEISFFLICFEAWRISTGFGEVHGVVDWRC